jgi:hypothetical protein
MCEFKFLLSLLICSAFVVVSAEDPNKPDEMWTAHERCVSACEFRSYLIPAGRVGIKFPDMEGKTCEEKCFMCKDGCVNVLKYEARDCDEMCIVSTPRGRTQRNL